MAATVAPIAFVLYPLVHIITLELTGLSAYYVYRQKMSAYSFGRGPLLVVHILFMGLVVFELLRTSLLSTNFIDVYTIGGTIFILADVILLTLIAVTVYLVPKGVGYRGIVAELFLKKQVLPFAAYVTFIVFAAVYLPLVHPFTNPTDPSQYTPTIISGLSLPSPQFTPFYLEVLLAILLIFMVYPSTLLVLAARKVKDKAIRRVLVILPVCWSGIGLDLLAFNGYVLSSLQIDATPFGYLIASVAFGVTALVFRRASLLTGFFEPTRARQPGAATYPFSNRLGSRPGMIREAKALLEVDSSLAYEQVVVDFAVELSSNNLPVYAFTSKGSPVYNALSRVPGVRFYILSGKVSYPRPDDQPFQVLVPNNDQAVLLDLLDKTIASNSATGVAIIFDSVSDIVLLTGVETAYKFLKQANESMGGNKVASVFLMTTGAHEDRVVNVIRGLFPNIMLYDASGLRLTRSA
jgi:hypothetical protein